ncbi:hypothetical protein GCK32_008151 [Trichostrongylus colubriformis]|uniref:Uncharacterized protein n=1 Tax=Trichostrongylus colubriformis TaxID=6319 RepID=A0AAN8EXJ3_TRICO
MEQDDDEPDEDEEFLRAAEKIIDDFRKGIDVSHLVRRLKRPAHSYDEDATGGIYEVLEMIASLDKSTRSPSASPPPASSPMPTDERSNFNINQLNGSTKKRLCFSPTSQVGECGNNLSIFTDKRDTFRAEITTGLFITVFCSTFTTSKSSFLSLKCRCSQNRNPCRYFGASLNKMLMDYVKVVKFANRTGWAVFKRLRNGCTLVNKRIFGGSEP